MYSFGKPEKIVRLSLEPGNQKLDNEKSLSVHVENSEKLETA